MNRYLKLAVIASLGTAFVKPGLAADDPSLTKDEAAILTAETVGAETANAADVLFSGAEMVTDESLRRANGREAVSLNAADIRSIHGGNQANEAVTGNATIGTGAMSDINGTAAVVMNTGNNSVIQVSQQIIFNLY